MRKTCVKRKHICVTKCACATIVNKCARHCGTKTTNMSTFHISEKSSKHSIFPTETANGLGEIYAFERKLRMSFTKLAFVRGNRECYWRNHCMKYANVLDKMDVPKQKLRMSLAKSTFQGTHAQGICGNNAEHLWNICAEAEIAENMRKTHGTYADLSHFHLPVFVFVAIRVVFAVGNIIFYIFKTHIIHMFVFFNVIILAIPHGCIQSGILTLVLVLVLVIAGFARPKLVPRTCNP
jgi:hypothetical protein